MFLVKITTMIRKIFIIPLPISWLDS